jgi:CRP-like cAMP-binding protein
MTPTVLREPVGQQAPPPDGYTVERFRGYVEGMERERDAMRARRDRRAVFQATYSAFSRRILAALEARRFEDMAWATDIACRFVEVYHEQVRLWEARDPALCRPWRAAFEAMEEGRINVLQAMFLGMNAHINYDLAFVTLGSLRHAGDLAHADRGERSMSVSRTGAPMVRYRDFLVINRVAWEAIGELQDTILGDYNRLLYWGNRLALRATRFLGQRVFMEARDEAWIQATLLTHARDEAERAWVARLIDAYAASMADLIGALTLNPAQAVDHAIGWTRRGDRIDPDLQAGLIEMAMGHPVIAELVLRELAFAGADPVSVLVTLLARGETRLAGTFGRIALRIAPRRRRRRLARFLRVGSDHATAIVIAMVSLGAPIASLPRGAPLPAARRRIADDLARDLAWIGHPFVRDDPALGSALAHCVRSTRALLERLGGPELVGPAGEHHDPTRLREHPDPWVRACAAALLEPSAETTMATIERVMFLKASEIFMEVDVPVLVNVAERLDERRYAPGTVFIRTGEPTGGIHLIESGDVVVSQERDGRALTITTLGPHDAAGEISTLNGSPATADCTARSEVRCWFLPAPVLAELLHQHPRLGIGLLHVLSQRLAATTRLVPQAAGELA